MMRSPFNRFALAAGLLAMLCVLAPAQVAQACSGGGPPPIDFNYVIENADYFVKATVTQTDYFRQNAILQAEQFLTGGSGPELFLLSQFDPTYLAIRNRYTYARCADAGYYFFAGDTAYFAINRAVDGSYHFPSAPEGYELNGMIPIEFPLYLTLRGDSTTVEISDEQSFLELVADISGQAPAEPYPMVDRVDTVLLTAPLLITTEHSTQYMLPVDSGALVNIETPLAVRSDWRANAYPNLFELPDYCSAAGCQLDTPDRSLTGARTEANTVQFGFAGGFIDWMTTMGQAFAFSSTSEAVVIWRDNFLDIYLISIHESQAYDEIRPALDLLTQIPLATSETITANMLHGLATWSADGTTLTYGDADGVWVLDIFRQRAPELVAAVEDGHVPSPLALSTNARYLMYTWDRTSSQWTTLDRMTGETFENALVSPNERYMAFIMDSNEAADGDEVACQMPLSYNCRAVMIDSPRYFEWVEDEYYVVIECDENEICSFNGEQVNYFPADHRPYHLFPHPVYTGWLGAFDYDSRQMMMAFVTAPQQVAIFYTLATIDLSDQLDGAIVDIEWLPSLFYDAPE